MAKKAIFLILFCHIIVYSLFSSGILANEGQYSNQLLKLNVEKVDENDNVNVTVYSSKPYKIKLNPVKKNDNEYEIFLPNTYHSITSKQDLSSAGNDIQDVDVKLIPNIESKASNGYTRIAIKTKNNNIKLDVNNEVVKKDNSLNEELLSLISPAHKTKKITKISKYPVKKATKLQRIAKTSINNKTKSKIKVQHIKIKPKIQPVIAYKPVLVETSPRAAIIVKKPVIQKSKTIIENNKKTELNKNNLKKKRTSGLKKTFLNAITLLLLLAPSFGLVFLILAKLKWKKPINLNFEAYYKENNLNNFDSYSEVDIQELENQHFDPTLEIIEGIEISDNKSIYLVQIEQEKALVGIANSNIYLLNKFDEINTSKFTVKKADKAGKNRDMFYVQLGSWRGLISSKQNQMNLELVF